MFEDFGELLGWLTIIGYGLALMNNPIRWFNKHLVNRMHKDHLIKRYYLKLMRLIIQKHRWFAAIATVSLLLHLILQITFRWVSTSGLIAAAFMVINVLIGAYGQYYRKTKRTLWFVFHRVAALMLIAGILNHLV